MQLGIIARPEDRGLGLQTWEATRHLDCSVLVVDVLEDRSDIASHWDRFPDATRAVWQHGKFTRPRIVKDWLDSVDVVYTAETFYDTSLPAWAAQVDTRTVCHLNPEFWRPLRLWDADAWWSATPWRLEHVAPGTEVVPYPVALERFTPVAPHDGRCRWLHIAGRRAIYDRNGTEALLDALPLLQEPAHVTISVQDGDELPQIGWLPPHVHVEFRRHVDDYWRLYDDMDALVMPRRYGGLCMPVQEAMAAGLAVVMPDVSPNPDTWPVKTCATTQLLPMHMRAGAVEVADLDLRDLASAMDAMANPDERMRWQSASRYWAREHSWEAQAPCWLERFAALHAA